MTSAPARVDRCPGALTLHQAQDGLLARVRVPGGRITGPALLGLARLAGAGGLELTSRANLQVRGVQPGVADAVADLGLMPSPTHERVRNIVASPLATSAGFEELLRAVDAGVCATPELVDLSGRFLFGLDDGSGDVAALRPDAWAVGVGGGKWWVGPASVVVPTAEVVGELLAAAGLFLTLADGAWRVGDLADRGAALATLLRRGRPRVPAPVSPPVHPPAGVVGDLVVAQVPAGRLDVTAAEALAATEFGLRITPWRSVVVAGPTSAGALRAAGLVVGPSLWTRVTACTGRPGCAQALADVRADAATAVAHGRITPVGTSLEVTPRRGGPGGPAHWSGCERRCGRPTGGHVDVVARSDGYHVAVLS